MQEQPQTTLSADMLALNPHLTSNWTINKAAQDLLALKYREMRHHGIPLPRISETGFRAFSQNDEDGILHFIFSLIGSARKNTVEICCGDGIECNSANLIVNHGWTGLLVEADAGRLARGQGFYANCRDTFIWPPTLVQSWITAANVNQVIRDNGVSGEVDLLSIDMDGVDYWIWKAIDCITPRVVVVEYQDILGPDRAVTVPYSPDFRAQWNQGTADYCGASLAAFVKLGRAKGYRLVGCNRYGFNAFFIRDDLGGELLPEIPAAACFEHPKVHHGMRTRLPRVEHMDWVEV